jgi:cytoskeletal protein RodZ
MESIGEKLRGAREEKGYSIDQVARDTNIARRFVEALEREDFSVFPGDPYVLGFLRNYADYLGLDPEKVVTLYKNLKIQEQPVPVEELIQRKKKLPVGLIALVLFIVALLGAGGYGVFYYLQNRPAQAETTSDEAEAAETREPDYDMREEILEQPFEVGELIRIHLGEEPADLLIESVGETVTLEHEGGTNQIPLGEERILDIDGDEKEDIKAVVHEIDADAGTAVIRFDRSLFDAAGGTASREEIEEGESSGLAIGSTSTESRRQSTKTILTSDEPEAFPLSVVFRGYCLLRYRKDGAVREERYFHKGETFRLDVAEEVMLWISNAGSFKARVGGEEVSFGGPGEVSTKLIRWEPVEDEARYQLKLIPVY